MPAVVPKSSSFYLSSVDITPFLEHRNSPAAQQVIDDVRAACISTGFFQMTGLGIPESLQSTVFEAAAKFFSLPEDVKRKLDARNNIGYRGMGSQLYEDDVLPDLKEGFFIGTDMSLSDPRVVARRFFMGPNVWPPAELLAHQGLREPVEAYYQAMTRLCHTVLDPIAATLPYGPHVFDELKANGPACPMRLLHYPPTRPAATAKDEHPGLEVHDRETGDWVEVPPNKSAYVVNMGDIISRITGGLHKSSIHRVLNKNPTDRYSIVYFFDGNIDYKLQRLDWAFGQGEKNGCEEGDEKVLAVEEHMIERTVTTYNLSKKK